MRRTNRQAHDWCCRAYRAGLTRAVYNRVAARDRNEKGLCSVSKEFSNKYQTRARAAEEKWQRRSLVPSASEIERLLENGVDPGSAGAEVEITYLLTYLPSTYRARRAVGALRALRYSGWSQYNLSGLEPGWELNRPDSGRYQS